jgi:hypothetical protein
MNRAGTSNQRLAHFALIAVGWTLYGLFFASQSYFRQAYFGHNPDWQGALSVWLTCGYSWAILTPPILYFFRRFPFSRDNWLPAIVAHLPLSVGFSLAALALYSGLRILLTSDTLRSFTDYESLVVGEIHACMIVYFAILGVASVVNYLSGPARFETAIDDWASADRIRPVPTIEPRHTEPPPAREQRERPFAERFTVKQNGRIIFVNVSDLDLITSEGNYVKLHTNGRSYLLRETMKSIEQRLNPSSFIRVRRSAIVRIERIKELHPMFNGEFEIVLNNGTKIFSSRRYRKNLDTALKS